MNNLVIIISIYLALTNFALSEIFNKNVKMLNQYKVIGIKISSQNIRLLYLRIQ